MGRLTVFGLPLGELPSIELANRVLKERLPNSRLTIIAYHGKTNPNTGKVGRHNYWKVECECGNEFVVLQSSIMDLKWRTISCGCYHKENVANTHTTHGDTKMSTPHNALYTSWQAMKNAQKNEQ